MRRLIFYAILLIAILAPRDTASQSSGVTSIASGNWSSPGTWSGGVIPSAALSVTITAGHVVTLNSDSTIAGMTIQNGGELRYLPSASVTLSSTANIIAYGRLSMKPSSAAVDSASSPQVVHTLRFVGIDESKFKGGGMSPVASDVGLWVMCTQDAVMGPNDPFPNLLACAPNSPGGTLDLAGTSKTAWTRAAGNVAIGATQIQLQVSPVGWQIGDILIIAPTENPSVGAASHDGFEGRAIMAVNGNTVTLSSPIARSHPAVVNPWNGAIYTAEILNMTRNVRIEGTGNGNAPLAGNGRSHIFIRSTQPQSIKYVFIRYMGPRKPDGAYTLPVTGRYGLHFHHSMDWSRGSVVEGMVCRDAGNRCFVPHASHGITFRDTISYNTFDEPYWWDAPLCQNCPEENINDSHDITIDHAVAALVRVDPDFRGSRLAGFVLRQGNNNSLINSVAVGVRGKTDAAGFQWPESGHGLWLFEDNISHNNKINGIFVWQNDQQPHTIRSTVAYYNGGKGIDLGAYRNEYNIIDFYAIGNTNNGLFSRANSTANRRPDGYAQAWERVYSTNNLRIAEHNLPAEVPVLFKGCTIPGVTVLEDISPGEVTAKDQPGQYDFVNCTRPDGLSLEPSDFNLSAPQADSIYRVQRPDGTAYQVLGTGAVTDIAPFYALPTPTPVPAPTPTPVPTPQVLSELGETVKWILQQYPHVRQELEAAGVID